MGPKPNLSLRGVQIYQGYFDRAAQRGLVEDLRNVLHAAPLIRPVTPSGQPMSVRMSAAGQFGWVSDKQGYHYAPRHPRGTEWPDIPATILKAWDDLSDCARSPECCLINWYGEGARMGLHQDKDEADFSCPVVSISLGDKGLFRVGNTTRGGTTESVWLESGDVVVMGGDARLKYHGVDRISHKSSTLLPDGGRINLTLRVVT